MDQSIHAMRKRPPSFSKLSSDLKLDIFGLLRSKHDQGSSRLVCRDWNHHVRYQMFKRIKTSLRSSFPQDSAQLAQGEDSCADSCFHHIRSLIVGGRHQNPDLYNASMDCPHARFSSPCITEEGRYVGPQYDTRLFSVLRNIRDNQLLDFESPRETPLTGAQLVELFRHQSNLRSFRARIDLSDMADEDRIAWTAKNTPLFFSALQSLKTLRIYVGYHSTEARMDSRPFAENINGLLLKASLLLESLEICGWPHLWSFWSRQPGVPLMAVFENAENSVHIPQTLRHLMLADMTLKDSPEIFLDAVNNSRLQTLRIEFCTRPWDFISRLALIFRRKTSQIKALTIRTHYSDITGDDACHDGEVKDLLLSLSGLETLEFDTVWARAVDWDLCLSRHQHLKSILVSSSDIGYRDRPPLPQMLAIILRRCPNLRIFAFRPLFPSFGKLLECQLPTDLPSELLECLDAVATAPDLSVLRLIYAPGSSDGELRKCPIIGLPVRGNPVWAEKAGQIAHRQASLILRHLHSKGSNIRVLAMSPISRWEQHRGDRNLHYYPHYFYEPRMVEQDGKQVVEAFPLRDYAAENPDAAVYV